MKKTITGWGVGVLLLAALLSGCTTPDTTPPTLSITSPSPNTPVSGNVAVLVNAIDETTIKSVDLYVKGKGSHEKGVFVNSAVGTNPYVINWNTAQAIPNQTDLDLVAVAKDDAGNESSSPPVTVRTQNTASPTLSLITAYSFAEDALLTNALTTASHTSSQLPASLRATLLPSELAPPLAKEQPSNLQPSTSTPSLPTACSLLTTEFCLLPTD